MPTSSRPAKTASQRRLRVDPAEIPAHAAVRPHDAVAGHHDREGVGGARGPDRAGSLGTTRELCDLRVAGGAPVRDVAEMSEDSRAEAGRQAPVEGQSEALATPGEVLVELACGGVEASRMTQDAGADVAREVFEHAVVVLARVGDSDQSRVGRGEQQASDGAVDDAVGDVEHVLGLSVRGEPLAKPAHVIVVDGHCPLQGIGEVELRAHSSTPFWVERRSVAMPSAAARRAASAVPPKIPAISA